MMHCTLFGLHMFDGRLSKTWRDIICLFLFSIFVKSFFFYLALDWYSDDEFLFIYSARLFADGHMPYVDYIYYYLPAFITILSIPHFFFENSFYVLRIITSILDSFNACLIYLIAKNIYSRKTGILATILYLTNVLSIKNSVVTMSEPYMLFFILLGFYILHRFRNEFFSAFFFAIGFFIKQWVFLIIMPAILYLVIWRKQSPKLLVYIFLFLFVFSIPLLFILDDFILGTKAYLFLQTRFSMLDRLIVIGFILFLTQPFLLLLYFPIVLTKLKVDNNYLLIWSASTLIFFSFKVVYAIHHLLLTLPPTCIIVAHLFIRYSEKVKTEGLDKYIFKIFSVFVIILFLPVYYQLLSYYGPLPNRSEGIDMISDYLRKNAFNDSMIIQDQAYYSYFSGVDDVTHHGWCLNMDHFYLDDVIFVINETRPAYIVATYEGRYPEGAIAYFNETYTLIDF